MNTSILWLHHARDWKMPILFSLMTFGHLGDKRDDNLLHVCVHVSHVTLNVFWMAKELAIRRYINSRVMTIEGLASSYFPKIQINKKQRGEFRVKCTHNNRMFECFSHPERKQVMLTTGGLIGRSSQGLSHYSKWMHETSKTRFCLSNV